MKILDILCKPCSVPCQYLVAEVLMFLLIKTFYVTLLVTFHSNILHESSQCSDCHCSILSWV